MRRLMKGKEREERKKERQTDRQKERKKERKRPCNMNVSVVQAIDPTIVR
jgi:hypothetical protein